MKKSVPEELMVHEWVSVIMIVATIGMLAVNAYLTSPPLSDQLGEPHYLLDPFIEVFVEGSVESPGSYQLLKGSTVGEVLKNAKPFPDADLSKINRSAKIRRNQVIRVPLKKKNKSGKVQ